jgi:hypothetical protein
MSLQSALADSDGDSKKKMPLAIPLNSSRPTTSQMVRGLKPPLPIFGRVFRLLNLSKIRKNQIPRQRATMLSLPTELILQIADYLPIESLVILNLTCERLRGMFSSKTHSLRYNESAAKCYFQLLARRYRTEIADFPRLPVSSLSSNIPLADSWG